MCQKEYGLKDNIQELAENLSKAIIKVYRYTLGQKGLQANYNLKLKNTDYNRPGRPLKRRKGAKR